MTTDPDTNKHARYAAYELIDTEKTYLSRLEAVEKAYISNLQDFKIIDANDFETQFGCWDTLLKICRRFYSKLETQRNETSPKLGNIIYEFCEDPDFFIFQVYLVKFEAALNRRGVLMTTNRKFSQFVIDAQSDPRTFGFTIESLLIEPVARVPRYCLLLDQLIKYSEKNSEEYDLLTKSLIKIKSITSENNDAIQQRENKMKVLSIMMNIDSKTRVNLVDNNDRQFIREGVLERQCRRYKKEFMFWLFSDKLLYGELSSSSAFSRSRNYTLHRVINLYETCVVHEVHGINEKPENAFMIMSKSKSFILWAKNRDEKTQWCKDIDAAITNLQTVGKFNHHTKYAPVWIPDAFVQTCMECDVSFTTLRRKHHCRLCGSIVCNECSKHRILAENIDKYHEVRVCGTCMSKTAIIQSCITPSQMRSGTEETIFTNNSLLSDSTFSSGSNISSPQPTSTSTSMSTPTFYHFSSKVNTLITSLTSSKGPPSPMINGVSSKCQSYVGPTVRKRRSTLSDLRSSIDMTTTISHLSVNRLSSKSRHASPLHRSRQRSSTECSASYDLKTFLFHRSEMLDQINPNRRHDLHSRKQYIAERIIIENDYNQHHNRTSNASSGQNSPYKKSMDPLDSFDLIMSGNSIQRVDSDGEQLHQCRLCEHPFTILRTKRTCSNCGSNVCPDCSQKKFMIPYINVKHPVRVCDDCYIVLSHGLGSIYEPTFRRTTSLKGRRSLSNTIKTNSQHSLFDLSTCSVTDVLDTPESPHFQDTKTPKDENKSPIIDTKSPTEDLNDCLKSDYNPDIFIFDTYLDDVSVEEDAMLQKYYRDLSPVKRIQMLSREVREANKQSSPHLPLSESTRSSPLKEGSTRSNSSILNGTMSRVMSMKSVTFDNSNKSNVNMESSRNSLKRISFKQEKSPDSIAHTNSSSPLPPLPPSSSMSCQRNSSNVSLLNTNRSNMSTFTTVTLPYQDCIDHTSRHDSRLDMISDNNRTSSERSMASGLFYDALTPIENSRKSDHSKKSENSMNSSPSKSKSLYSLGLSIPSLIMPTSTITTSNTNSSNSNTMNTTTTTPTKMTIQDQQHMKKGSSSPAERVSITTSPITTSTTTTTTTTTGLYPHNNNTLSSSSSSSSPQLSHIHTSNTTHMTIPRDDSAHYHHHSPPHIKPSIYHATEHNMNSTYTNTHTQTTTSLSPIDTNTIINESTHSSNTKSYVPDSPNKHTFRLSLFHFSNMLKSSNSSPNSNKNRSNSHESYTEFESNSNRNSISSTTSATLQKTKSSWSFL